MTDVLGALALSVFVIGITTVAAIHQPEANSLWIGGYALLAGAALPLLVRGKYPLIVFAVSIVCTLIYYWTGYPGGPAILLPALALYTLTTVRGVLVAGIAGATVLVASYIAFVASGRGWLPGAPSAGFVAGIAAVIGIGAAVRSRKAATKANREQREEHERRLAEQERLRIAREVHDVVAHSLAMINVQAGVAAHVADRRPEQAKEALRNIKSASAEALADLRATLAVLRSADATAPAPSLRMLDELLDHARAAGFAVTVHGESGELPAPVDAAAYRILQESLTNVARHADNARAVEIRFERADGELTLVVRDDGEPPRSPKPGNGLRGMRERVDALGGKVEAGPSTEGTGFQVTAVLPVEG
ncbi:two-component sensor histidine kinase [Prauserella marina]|uniref:histidine kinase n=1 Tax=Prauserella marina TaxID=530584 RepID=A0A222VYP7_9PSEU|nr:sensor histidine kinase [Prauserella marina]ASR38831.1 two-component sensor histidine kinase [Prauserella marina]PWV82268.1 signal transduction histidine kinase [Prauserella marina]SDC64793.1 Signal transduction histidine kinase [Prauserella marina]